MHTEKWQKDREGYVEALVAAVSPWLRDRHAGGDFSFELAGYNHYCEASDHGKGTLRVFIRLRHPVAAGIDDVVYATFLSAQSLKREYVDVYVRKMANALREKMAVAEHKFVFQLGSPGKQLIIARSVSSTNRFLRMPLALLNWLLKRGRVRVDVVLDTPLRLRVGSQQRG
jgi:hypothetical protein